MTPAARVAAAIEVLADIETRRRPAADALKDWGLAHRFAGSGDRAADRGLVYDALRRKASSAWIMGEASPRAEVLGALQAVARLSAKRRSPRCSAARAMRRRRSTRSGARAADARGDLAGAPGACAAATIPNGWRRHSPRVSARTAVDEGRALADRAPVDLRVNALKADRDARAWPRSPISAPRRRRSRRSGCASPCAATAAARRSPPSRPTSRASSKFRTRARNSRRC